MQTQTKVSQEQLTGASGRAVVALRFTGDISSASKEAILGAYRGLEPGKGAILLDFAAVDYLNSSGIALVIQVLIEASKAERTVGICGLTKHFAKVFTMVGIPKYAGLYADEETALAAL